MLRILLVAFLMLGLLCCVAWAEDTAGLLNRFYAGLSDIIESNMGDPEGCVREVSAYYQNNQALIAQIREVTEKAMSQAAPMMTEMMEQYSSMSKEELEAMGKRYEGTQGDMSQRGTTFQSERYTKALDTFATKYPQAGMQIGLKALELMPSFAAEQFKLPEEQAQW